MKQTVMWLALALLFAIGATLSIIADSFGPAATAETTAPATLVEAPQPVVAANAKPAEPEVPVAMLDDVPPRPVHRDRPLALKRLLAGSSHPAQRRRRGRPRRCSRPCHSLQQRPRPLPANPGKTPKRASSRRKPTPGQPESPGQQRATASQEANGQRQGMRLAKPVFGSVATIEFASRCSTRRSAA